MRSVVYCLTIIVRVMLTLMGNTGIVLLAMWNVSKWLLLKITLVILGILLILFIGDRAVLFTDGAHLQLSVGHVVLWFIAGVISIVAICGALLAALIAIVAPIAGGMAAFDKIHDEYLRLKRSKSNKKGKVKK